MYKRFISVCMYGLMVFSSASCTKENTLKTNLLRSPASSMARYRFDKNINYDMEPASFPVYSPDSVVKLAYRYINTPYKADGKLPGGFDCSGFVFFIYRQFGIYLPPSTEKIALVGTMVRKNKARKGDLIFFKGENKFDTHAGHVGIVVNEPGEPLKFIHSSTSKGIRYDFVEDNFYFKQRFMFIKRVIEE